MRKIVISLPDALFAELQAASAATGEQNYGPASWAGDLVASELAARRLPRIAPGRIGARITAEIDQEIEPYRVVLPGREPKSR